jgi:diacylglycerol kinase family enzyme
LRLLLIVNTAASSVTARARVVIQKALSADHRVTMVETGRPGHATTLAREAAAGAADVVVVLGGDGTLNEAANGLAGTGVALAVLPGGSTNVFARSIGLPNDPVEGTAQLLGTLGRRSFTSVNLGSVNGRYFLFNAGFGFDAAVVARVERRSALKRYAGQPFFAWAAASTWASGYDHSRPRLKVEVEGSAPVEDGYFAVGLNSDPYTFVRDRPLRISPGTGLQTPLAVVTFRSLSLGRFVPAVAAAAGPRGMGRRRSVARHVGVQEAVISGYGPLPHQVDGEYLGEATRFRLRSEQGVLRLVIP